MLWRPAHVDHAIERTSVTVQLAEPIPQKSWDRLLRSTGPELQKIGFGGSQSVDAIRISLTPGFGANVAGGRVLNQAQMPFVNPGQHYQLNIDNQIHEEITLQRNVFIYTTNVYRGWSVLLPRFLTLISIPLSEALAVVNINFLKLEYWDRFTYDGLISDVDYRSLLRDSDFIPRFSSKTSDLWHSHVGYFMPIDMAEKCLVNINVDVLDIVDMNSPRSEIGEMSPKRSVGIYSLAQTTFSPPKLPQISSELGPTLEEMHTILKGVLGDVITADAAKLISLNSTDVK